MSKGIDVSHYQGLINWLRMAEDGVTFAFCKATEGSEDGSAYVDPTLEYNVKQAHSVSIEVGVYHFARFISVGDARNEADWFIKNTRGLPITLPFVLDLESNHCKSDKEMNAGARAFLERVKEKTGHPVMLYSFGNFFRDRIDKQLVKDYPYWHARYSKIGPINMDLEDIALWQNTSKGDIGDITPIDMNIPGGKWKCWDKDHETADPKPQKPKPEPKPEPKPKPKSKWHEVTGNWHGQTLKEGDHGEPVKQLQQMLCKLYFYPDKHAKNNGVDGYYGEDTEDAVARFQKINLPHEVDGKAGPHTYAKLKEEIRDQKKSKPKHSSKKVSGIPVKGHIKIVNVARAAFICDRPSDHSKNLSTAKKGSVLPISGSVPGWWEVIYKGQRAYVNENYGKRV
ncbi:GH25 family lysozyme M1 (1,4-beta-N-acetylmuramidase) [Scopulibacillus darangshiensis]|uniref:GH25 family lysozyme M1 (1,4-beta-N-acetylmuramidase) n=1 Tax=Scopulibacillus darangshiensis TaxID=442528 RepID=A0A4R2PCP3_9BACL|nr:GH25 family lysozyme [Scopulibacillus darangshiensis]TCP32198.1 GH25 family lysozyme M1 (1,4-beta-N-acetylmuramidase) [Scopulibacillus darangshiensis]